ncbi:MAG: T9SS type A sorting domain-containing protein, partial [Bacteroidota bacterium]
QGLVYAWDPTANSGAGGHVPLVRSGGLDGSGDDASVWQGFMIEVTPDGASGPTITYAAAMRDAAASPPFYGKTSGLTASGATPEIRFTLSGARGEDRAWLRFLPDAEKGFERHDGSSFSSAAARIAFPVSDRTEGARRAMRHLAMNALPDGSAAPLPRTVNVPMDLAVSEAGTFTLSWEDALSDGWTAYLVDRETGDRVKMWRQTSYTFDASEGDWSRRFLVTVRPASGAVSVAPEAASKAEAETRVGEVYPNPTSGAGRVEVVLGAEQTVRIAVIDALGREVAVAHDGPLAEGSTAVALPVASLAAGTYVVRVTGEGVAETRRLTVTR